jgi:hypothetical protein
MQQPETPDDKVKRPDALRIWGVKHGGVWLSGFSVVVAPDETAARELLSSEIEGWAADAEFTEIPYRPGAHLLWNGDY